MNDAIPALSTDQVAAFVELARRGSIRAAGRAMKLTEQGVRNRVVALEQRLGIALYRKQRGVRRGTLLTEDGDRFLPQAVAFLDAAREMVRPGAAAPRWREIHIAASQYLTWYFVIDVIRKFHHAHPDTRVCLSVRSQEDIERMLLSDPSVSLGIAAPGEVPPSLQFTRLFSMPWRLVTPTDHPLLRRKQVRLIDAAEEPMILYERQSTGGRQIRSVMSRMGIVPRITMEATHTQIIVRMVEAGLGVAILPLLPGDVVTRQATVATRPIRPSIPPVHCGILSRRGEALSGPAVRFLEFLRQDEQIPSGR